TLQKLFPHTRFVFPLAPRHRATIYARSIIHQWFDSWHLDDPNTTPIDAEEWRCVDGLRDTVAYLHRLIREEAGLVGGVKNVVLGGLSQGCAASLMAVLLWDGEPLGGYLGMCGWLVFERDVEGVLARGWDEFDPFEREDGDGDRVSEQAADVEARVVRALREKLELEHTSQITSRPRSFDTPVFLGHGTEDDKVPVARGKGAAECLRAAGLDAKWRVYRGLGHWYSPTMLADMATFL
ncbi:alpha/beta-hydrolase, partial [Parathielavia hyrcaniae]